MNQEFKDAVKEQNTATVRMMLTNELLLDPRGNTFAGMLKYAKDNLPDLFETEEPSRFSIPTDKEEWNDEILSKMKRDLNMNFSVEKLAVFEEMAKYLGSQKAENLNQEDQKRAEQKKARSIKEKAARENTRMSNKKKGTIITGSGAVIAITGLFVEGTVGTILSVVGGALAIGGVLLISASKESK